MCITHLPTKYASVATPPDFSTSGGVEGGGGSSIEQVWTGHQWLPLDVTSKGAVLGLGIGSYASCLEGGQDWEWSQRGALYSEIQCMMDNGHMGTWPCEQRDW